jgi:hypothetical protein
MSSAKDPVEPVEESLSIMKLFLNFIDKSSVIVLSWYR